LLSSFPDTPTPQIYTLSLHDALPILRLRDVSDETGLLAIQGPQAEQLLASLTPVGVGMIPYYHFTEGKVAGAQCFISRTGYTGEDRKSTRLNSSHVAISYAVFCLKKK